MWLKSQLFYFTVCLFAFSTIQAQDPSAVLELESTSKGVLIPRMTSDQREMIATPTTGLLVFDTDTESFWFKNSITWIELSDSLDAPDQEISDLDQDTRITVEANADEDMIRMYMGGEEAFQIKKTNGGFYSLQFPSNSSLVALGESAGNSTTALNSFNTCIGQNSGAANNGVQNLFIGTSAGSNNLTGWNNTMVGSFAGQLSKGQNNIFLGHRAGQSELGSYKLYIEPSESETPLIYGDFAQDYVRIYGDLHTDGQFKLTDGSQAEGFVLTCDTAGLAGWQNLITIQDSDQNTKIQVEESADDNIIRFDVDGSEAMFIDSNGDVQIGNGVTSRKLGVGPGNNNNQAHIGYAVLGSKTDNVLSATFSHQSYDNSTDYAIRQNNSGNTYLNAGSNKSIFFSLNGQNVGRIRSDLNDGGFSFYYPTGAGRYVFKIENQSYNSATSSQYNGLQIKAGRDANNSANSRMIQFVRPDGTEIGKIVQNGANTVSYNTSSDARLKMAIRPTAASLDQLLKIDVMDYEFIEEPGQQFTGFIAQELFEQFPQAVTEGGANAKTDPWMVDYGQLTPLLVKAVQDLKKMIETQQLMIASQQKEIEALKGIQEN